MLAQITREVTEGSSVASKRKSLIKRELKKVIINCVMLQIPNKICFQFSFPIHSARLPLCCLFFSSLLALSLSLTIQYFILFFMSNAQGGKSREKAAARKLISVKRGQWTKLRFFFTQASARRKEWGEGEARAVVSLLWRNLNPLCMFVVVVVAITAHRKHSRHTLLHQLTVSWFVFRLLSPLSIYSENLSTKLSSIILVQFWFHFQRNHIFFASFRLKLIHFLDDKLFYFEKHFSFASCEFFSFSFYFYN